MSRKVRLNDIETRQHIVQHLPETFRSATLVDIWLCARKLVIYGIPPRNRSEVLQ